MTDQRGDGWWEASDGKWYPPESRPDHRPAPPTPAHAPPNPWSAPASVAPATAGAADPEPEGEPRRSRKPVVLGAAVVGVVAVAAIGFVAFSGGSDAESEYLDAIDAADVDEWATDRAAVNAGYLVCEDLDGGSAPRGSDADLIAVQHLCPDYEDAFRVLEQQIVSGTFTVFDRDEWLLSDEGDSCFPDGGYGDVNSSTQVVVRSGSSTELARTNLGSGQIGIFQGCQFSFDLSLTEGESIYIVEVGDRGEISYTWEEITAPAAIELSLGDALG
jgi:hypothetical protein